MLRATKTNGVPQFLFYEDIFHNEKILFTMKPLQKRLIWNYHKNEKKYFCFLSVCRAGLTIKQNISEPRMQTSFLKLANDSIKKKPVNGYYI